MFTNLLIQTCNIEEKTLSQNNYEQIASWSVKLSDIKCRKDSTNSPKIEDIDYRTNIDDDLFFFDADIDIVRGNRIVLDNEYYDVVKVNKVYNDSELHHLEVVGRFVDHN